MYAPVYSTKLVRESLIKYDMKISGSQAARSIVRELLIDEPAEVFAVVLLDTKHQVIGVVPITRGTLDASLVHPREVFRAAFLANASAMILAHNHPSGVTTPSREDYAVTKRLREAGRTLGVDVLDHLIVGDEVYSMAESCDFPS